jgi:hypothetical protein
LHQNLPGFDLFRRPADAAYIINFLLAVGLLLIGREAAVTCQPRASPPDRTPQATRNDVAGLWAIVLSIPLIAFYLGAAAQTEDALPILYRSYLEVLIRVLILYLLARLRLFNSRFRDFRSILTPVSRLSI